MENLRRLQSQFQDYLLENAPLICSQVVETPEVSVQARLGIYSHAYFARLMEVLASDFSGLQVLLGDDGFHQLCDDYLRAHPSVYRSVRWLASHLVNFLQTAVPYREYPVLSEMAAFEWGMQHVLDAANAKKIEVADMAAIPAEQWAKLHLKFHPALRRLDFKWNVVQIWQAVEQGLDVPQPEEFDYPVSWVLWRSQDLQILFSSLPVDEAWAMDRIAAGDSLGEICEGICEWIDEEQAGPRAAALLKNWLEEGMIVEVKVFR